MRTAFIVTKPLQFMIADMIAAQHHGGEPVDFLIVDLFAGASQFVERFNRLDRPGQRAIYFAEQPAAYAHAAETDYGVVHTNCDVGFRIHRMLKRLKGKSVRVYEEGVGTYRNDLYSGFRRRFLEKRGIGTVFGGSNMAHFVYVFDPARYYQSVQGVRAIPMPINGTLAGYVEANRDSLCYLFGTGLQVPSEEHATIYLTSWDVDQSVVEELQARGRFFIKPHPHRKDAEAGPNVLPGGVPAEVLIPMLAQAHPSLTVYHHGSSAAHYLAGMPGVEFKRLH
ncbi:MAG: hypothetical protein CL575_01650 [Altererythrobacter sp.]|nr:hypothetical protein [Altererythrobacter sp.]|tara:strand:+ start:7532 stop:8374 length:843 start_codon:yes stop_codon:yes gene_type:complete